MNVNSPDAVASTDRSFRARAAEQGAPLEGIWIQHMFAGDRELLVTALRDQEFGVMVGCGIGGGMTEVVDDVVFARAPLDAAGAMDVLNSSRRSVACPTFCRRASASWLPISLRASLRSWPLPRGSTSRSKSIR